MTNQIQAAQPQGGTAGEAVAAAFVCARCKDTHQTEVAGQTVPCTACPTPCAKCARDGGRGAYCFEVPCRCPCHAPAPPPPSKSMPPGQRFGDPIEAGGARPKALKAGVDRLLTAVIAHTKSLVGRSLEEVWGAPRMSESDELRDVASAALALRRDPSMIDLEIAIDRREQIRDAQRDKNAVIDDLLKERAAHAETRKALEDTRSWAERWEKATDASAMNAKSADAKSAELRKERDALKAELDRVRVGQSHPWRFAVEWGVEGSRARCACFRFERDANNYIARGMAGYAPEVIDLGPAPTATEAGKGEPVREGAVSERARLIYEGVVAIRVVSPIACPGTIGGCVDEAVQILRAAEAEATNGVGGEGRA